MGWALTMKSLRHAHFVSIAGESGIGGIPFLHCIDCFKTAASGEHEIELFHCDNSSFVL